MHHQAWRNAVLHDWCCNLQSHSINLLSKASVRSYSSGMKEGYLGLMPAGRKWRACQVSCQGVERVKGGRRHSLIGRQVM